MIIDFKTPLVVARQEPSGVVRAARDLTLDIEEVCGFRLARVDARPPDAKLAILVESDGKIARDLGLQSHLTRPETFIIRAVKLDGRDTILISGADERGAIYGIYHFSETHLGTDPFKFWTGYVPPRRSEMRLANIDHISPPPLFRFRGFHLERLNDIHGWTWITDFHKIEGTPGMHIYWEKVFETILRAKGNMVKPGDKHGPDSSEAVMAAAMGLCITQEHFAPLGVALREVLAADPGFDPSFTRNRQGFIDYWEAAVQRYPRPQNVIWTVGLRGAGDQPFWVDDPTADTDEKRGAIVTDAIATQVEIVKRRCGHLNPVFIHNLWMEGVRMYRDGFVKLPEGVHPVWADNGYGTFRNMLALGTGTEHMGDALPREKVGGKHGVYMHVSMYDMCAPDLEQFNPPERIQKELGRAIEREATAYLLVNVGRVREQCLGAQAVMELGWGNNAWSDPQRDGAAEFWKTWCTRHFGAAYADEAYKSYRDLYDIPFRWGKWGGWDDYVVGEMGFYRIARMLVQEMLCMPARKARESAPWKFFLNRAMTMPEQIAFVRSMTDEMEPKWAAASERALGLLGKLQGQPRDFFDENVVAQIEIQTFSNRYLRHTVDAVELYESNKLKLVAGKARAAQESIAQVRQAMTRMEHGKWRDWNKTNYWAGLEIADDTCALLLTTVELLTKPRRG